MFDIGFTELVLIFIVGLIVLGPERLPVAIRTGSLWLGRLRRSFASLKYEVEREIGADEIKRQLHNESILKNLKDAETTLKKGVSSIQEEMKESETQLKSLEYDISDVIKPETKPSDSDPS